MIRMADHAKVAIALNIDDRPLILPSADFRMPMISFVVFPFLVLVAATVHAQITPDCSTPQGVAAARTYIETSLQLVREDQKKREAEIDRELESRGAVNKWPKERRSQIFMSILSSAKFAAF